MRKSRDMPRAFTLPATSELWQKLADELRRLQKAAGPGAKITMTDAHRSLVLFGDRCRREHRE